MFNLLEMKIHHMLLECEKVKHELRVAIYEIRYKSYELKSTS